MKRTMSLLILESFPLAVDCKRDKVRVVHDWRNRKYGLNEALLNPPVKYGGLDDFLQLLSPGAYVGGVDFQD